MIFECRPGYGCEGKARVGVGVAPSMNVLESLFGLGKKTFDAPCVMGEGDHVAEGPVMAVVLSN